ncbi:mandelate racemase/muconate lactonizing enzyme family protein [Marinococcus halophilus]|uniref:mandelate racemase/muconate lactonizing enzyme family protein n=1 Tax=Marinococcus halophilus TaxID=1371 RepID=UPI0009A79DAB|nr:mandelate racemase/muconate lactonizing enzyme family protein [Marinococcus halophilus]
MEIVNVEAFPLKIDKGMIYLGNSSSLNKNDKDYYIRPEYRSIYSKKIETMLVKITTNHGIEGWGECLAPVAPEIPATIIENLFSSFLIGKDPRNFDLIWNTLYDSMRERGYFSGFMVDAITAIDVAVWDIIGKFNEQPIFQLLGGAYRNEIPAYVSGLPKESLQEKLMLAQEWKEKAFYNIKLHLGYSIEEDVKITSSLKNALEEVNFMVDAHWKYSPKEALILSKKLEPYNLNFLEAPVIPEDIEGSKFVRDNSCIPIAIGEAKRTKYQFKERLVNNAADIIQPDVGRAGITETKKIASMAEAFNVSVAPHLSVGLGISVAATLHVSASINNFYMLEYQPTVFPIANEILLSELHCSSGYYQLPKGPGLGITVDEEKVNYYSTNK